MKRSELRRKTKLVATGRLARRTRMKARNPTRRAAELLRCYGPPERRAFIKGLRCVWCGRTPCDNAHVHGNAGMGRKADATTIVPLCSGLAGCHAKYDQHRAPFDRPTPRAVVQLAAADIEQLWQDHLTRSGRTAE